MGFIHFMVGCAWELILIFIAFAIFGYITKNGFGAVREILSTITTLLKTFGHWVRKKCLEYLKKEESADRTDKQSAVAAYNEYLKKCRAQCMTFEEFSRKMGDGDTFTLD